jgi:hypothetical protein
MEEVCAPLVTRKSVWVLPSHLVSKASQSLHCVGLQASLPIPHGTCTVCAPAGRLNESSDCPALPSQLTVPLPGMSPAIPVTPPTHVYMPCHLPPLSSTNTRIYTLSPTTLPVHIQPCPCHPTNTNARSPDQAALSYWSQGNCLPRSEAFMVSEHPTPVLQCWPVVYMTAILSL